MNKPTHLRFAPDILRRLGEELIPNPEQGIIELIKNSYDADSKTCIVSFENILEPGGSIKLEDEGDGMSENDLLNGFLVLGRSRKDPTVKTKSLGRLPVGDKGLGRLAALRLGRKVIVRSRPKGLKGIELVLEIDWKTIDAASVVEDVELFVKKTKSADKQGVTIEILDLRKGLSKDDLLRLAREMVLLSDPFKSKTGFNVKLIAPEFKKVEALVKGSFFDDAEFFITAYTDESGAGKATFSDISGNVLNEVNLPMKGGDKYAIPPCVFQLWMYNFGPSFAAKSAGLSVVKNWIKTFGGVHVYHRNLRVRPYGDPGSDWLDMNLQRVSHPEFRPSTNNVIGRITTDDPHLYFSQPTNRIGFVENETFFEVKRFANEVLRWVADFRLSEALKKRKEDKEEAEKSGKDTLDKLVSIIRETIPKEAAGKVEAALKKFTKGQDKIFFSLREDLQLYRSLATAGTTAAVFAHEAAKPITFINSIANTIEFRGKKHLGVSYAANFEESVAQLKDISQSLSVYSQFPIHHLKKEKRRIGHIRIAKVWEEVVALFVPLLDEAKIKAVVEFDTTDTIINGSIALIEAIAANLITNSIYALTKEDARLTDRLIRISSRTTEERIQIFHADNGEGIKLDLQNIWLPGQTTNPQGTGFGLTIVRDSITDLQGTVKALANGELGGAEFILDFPVTTKQL